VGVHFVERLPIISLCFFNYSFSSFLYQITQRQPDDQCSFYSDLDATCFIFVFTHQVIISVSCGSPVNLSFSNKIFFFRRREQPNLQISYQLLFDLEQSVSTTSTFPSKENIDVPFRF